jgi:hypothetical protein
MLLRSRVLVCSCTLCARAHTRTHTHTHARHTPTNRGVLNVVHGTHDTVNAILDHPDIAAISFVGGDKAGRYIYQRAAANGKRVQVRVCVCVRVGEGLWRCALRWRCVRSSLPWPASDSA